MSRTAGNGRRLGSRELSSAASAKKAASSSWLGTRPAPLCGMDHSDMDQRYPPDREDSEWFVRAELDPTYAKRMRCASAIEQVLIGGADWELSCAVRLAQTRDHDSAAAADLRIRLLPGSVNTYPLGCWIGQRTGRFSTSRQAGGSFQPHRRATRSVARPLAIGRSALSHKGTGFCDRRSPAG